MGYLSGRAFSPVALWALLLVFRTSLGGSLPEWTRPFLAADVSNWSSSNSSVVLNEEGQLDVLDQKGRFRFRERVAMRILRPFHKAGDQRVALMLTGGDRLVSLRGWTVKPNQEVDQLESRSVAESSDFTDYILFSDIRYRHFPLPVNCVGCLFVYEWEKEGESLVPSWDWVFGGNHLSSPTLHSVFKLVLPLGGESRWNANDPTGVVFEKRNGVLHWEARDLAPLIEETNKPSFSEIVPHLIVTYAVSGTEAFDSWNHIALWFQHLFQGRLEATPAIKLQAEKLLSSVEGPVDKIKHLVDFVQQEIRYVAIEVGVGGYQPHPAGTVLEQRYGDCKDKVALLAALLSASGFECYPALISTREAASIDPAHPTFGFNHAVVALTVREALKGVLSTYFAFSPQEGILWIDPTASKAPLGYLPASIQGQYALVIRPEGGLLLRTPKLSCDENGFRRTLMAHLNPDGRLMGRNKERFFGEFSMQARGVYSGNAESHIVAALEGRFAAHVSSRITDLLIENAEPNEGDFTVHHNFELAQYGRRVGGLFILPALPFSKSNRYSVGEKERTYPVDFRLGVTEVEGVEITLPTGWQLEEPLSFQIESRFGTYEMSVIAVDAVLKVDRRFKLEEPVIPVDEVSDFRRFIEKVQSADGNQLVLRIPTK